MSSMSNLHMEITDRVMNFIDNNSVVPIVEIAEELGVPVEWVSEIYGDILDNLMKDTEINLS